MEKAGKVDIALRILDDIVCVTNVVKKISTLVFFKYFPICDDTLCNSLPLQNKGALTEIQKCIAASLTVVM